MKQFLSMVAILLLPVMMPCGAASPDVPDAPGPPPYESVWRAALRTVLERGLVILEASPSEGRITTGFAALDASKFPKTALPDSQNTKTQWAGGEYRYIIDIGRLSNRARISVRAEIWAWEQPDHTARPRPTERWPLQSNRSLEREFLKAFVTALGEVDED
jgi:hypothetical protein